MTRSRSHSDLRNFQVIDAEFRKGDVDGSESIDRAEFEKYVLANQLVSLPKAGVSSNDLDFARGIGIPTSPGKQHKFDSDPEVPQDMKLAYDNIETVGAEFWSAFFKSVAMIIATELGDKTFFIAAIMAMKHNRTLVYGGAIGALALMTVLSVGIGFALPSLLPKKYTHYAAVLLFGYFGYKLLAEAYEIYKEPPEKNEELEEVEQELGKSAKAKGRDQNACSRMLRRMVTPVLAQAFMLTFLAEWGDRSQIATIALASSKDPFGVTVGGTLGHAFCTGLAVIGGRFLATKISEQTVACCGGVLFFIFALHELYVGP